MRRKKTSVKINKGQPGINSPAIASSYALTQSRMRQMLEDAFVAGYESPIELMKQEIDRILLEESQERQKKNSPAQVESQEKNVDGSSLSPAFFSAEGVWKQYKDSASATGTLSGSYNTMTGNTVNDIEA